WSRASEALADERASAGGGDTALALAAGLVKVARLTSSLPAHLPISALHDGGDVEARVRRLVTAAGVERASGTGGAGEGASGLSRAPARIAALAFAATLAAGIAASLPPPSRRPRSAPAPCSWPAPACWPAAAPPRTGTLSTSWPASIPPFASSARRGWWRTA